VTNHLQLVPRLGTREAVPPLSHTCSWCDAYISRGTALPFFIFIQVVVLAGMCTTVFSRLYVECYLVACKAV
jgi:hypothetical protein